MTIKSTIRYPGTVTIGLFRNYISAETADRCKVKTRTKS